MSKKTILRVILPVPVRQIFDYLLPRGERSTDLQPGMRLLVPLGKRKLLGIIYEITDHSSLELQQLKHAIMIIDKEPLLPHNLIKLYHWASDYYHYPLGEIVFSNLPKNLQEGYSIDTAAPEFYTITELGKNKLSELGTRAKKQRALLNLLAENNRLSLDDIKKQNFSKTELMKLLERAWIEPQIPKRSTVEENQEKNKVETPIKLNSSQENAVKQVLHTQHFKTFLLAGITGSGKTEVYLHCIAAALQAGKQALVLVPEIALTPQTIERFQRRFAVSIVQLHSNLTDKKRLDAWQRASIGTARIVIGTRSAIFAPLSNLGIIILDEEHDTSFKQQTGFRYSARDLAVVRARICDIPIILGSATPALETLYNAMRQRYVYLQLPHRAGGSVLPKISLLDMRRQKLIHGMSTTLLNEIKKHLQQNNQVLLFLNRRGYAPTLMCHSCGWLAKCDSCDARLTLHFQPMRLSCHHCGIEKTLPRICGQCKQAELLPIGLGTEKIELVLKERFPHYSICRMDRDSTSGKGNLQKMLQQIHEGRAQIIVGTQMIAKGHHFPNLSLVAIIDTDAALFSIDFRAIERMAQLIMQVSGRAGRERQQGEVIIQTHYPDHPLLQLLLTQGYFAFAEAVLQERKATNLPPFSHWALFRAEALAKTQAHDFLIQVRQLITEKAHENIDILGPHPAPMERKADRFRSQLLLQSNSRTTLQQLLEQLIWQLPHIKNPHQVHWSLDIDPQEMI